MLRLPATCAPPGGGGTCAQSPFPKGLSTLRCRGRGSRGVEQARLSQPLLSSGQVLASSPEKALPGGERGQEVCKGGLSPRAETCRSIPCPLAGASAASAWQLRCTAAATPKCGDSSPEEEECGPASPSPAGNSSRCHLPRKKHHLSPLPLTHGPPENLDRCSAWSRFRAGRKAGEIQPALADLGGGRPEPPPPLP